MKKMIIAANWKMNNGMREADALLREIMSADELHDDPLMIICPPFTSLAMLSEKARGSSVRIGAQNCHYEEKGAFTGEISLPMLESAGCHYVIIGHSERRNIFGETDGMVARKIAAVLNSSLTPIFCIGETLEERGTGNTFATLQRQLDTAFKGREKSSREKTIIAYEPVWAIGTGLSASPEQIREAHTFIKEHTRSVFDFDPPVLYGGSLTPANADTILSQREVDGGLIGGASLEAASFLSIYEIAKKYAV